MKKYINKFVVFSIIATLVSPIALPTVVLATEFSSINTSLEEIDSSPINEEDTKKENSSDLLSSEGNKDTEFIDKGNNQVTTEKSDEINKDKEENSSDVKNLTKEKPNDYSESTAISEQSNSEEKKVLKTTYDSIISERKVHYDAMVITDKQDLYNNPGFTENAIVIGKTDIYLNKKVQIVGETITNLATWIQIAINGKNIGWMNKTGVNIQYDTLITAEKVNYHAVVYEEQHDIYTLPGYTKGNEIITKSRDYIKQTIQVIEEKKTSRATWVLIAKNNTQIGWMNKKGIKIQTTEVKSSKKTHLEGTIYTKDKPIFSAPGYTANATFVMNSSDIFEEKIQITEQKETTVGTTWFLISQNNSPIGWIEQNGVSIQYDTVLTSQNVHYDAIVTGGRHDVYTTPGYTANNEILTKSSSYLNRKVQIIKEITTNRAVWSQIKIDGKEVWLNKKGLSLNYDKILSAKDTTYHAIVYQGQHDIYTVPGYTDGNQIVDKSASFINEEIEVIQEKSTNRAVWAQISINGKNIGWMNKNGLKRVGSSLPQKIKFTQSVHYNALITKSDQIIYSLPAHSPDAKEVGKTNQYFNELVLITQETETDQAIWIEISLKGKTIGWIEKTSLVYQYDAIISSKAVHYDAVITQGHHDVYSEPGYTENNKILSKSTSYLNEKVQIIEEKKTNRATWLKFSINGKAIGWMNKNGVSLKLDEITSTKSIHYDAVITQGHHDVYSVPGYTLDNEILSKSAPYVNKKVQIIEEKVTSRATWLRFSINGKVIGWINKNGVSLNPEKINNTKTVHYDAVISAGHHDVYTVPGYTIGNQVISKSSSYMNKTIQVLKLAQTNRATFAEFSLDGKIIGWVNVTGVNYKYDEVSSTKSTSYNAKVVQGQHDIYSVPGYTKGNEILGKSNSYLNQSVKVLQEKQTNRATWALISLNGKTIGWMNKNGLSSMLIYLDPGHGGNEPGAISGGIKEKDVNLKVALKIEKLLVSNGYDVVMSRKTDKFVSLSNRAQEANKLRAAIFVSVHHNSFMGTSQGIETYAYNRLGSSTNPMSNNSKRSLDSGKLSSAVHSSLLSHSGAINRGTRTANFHVIRETNMPAILMELGYIDNATERAKLINDNYQNKLAKGAYEGIAKYFK